MPKIIRTSPFYKYLNGSEERAALISLNCGISLPQTYHLKQGRTPSLLVAIAIQSYTKGELKCRDLLPKEDRKKLEELEKNFGKHY